MRNLHQEITNQILAQLDAGVVPWRKPWREIGHAGMPRNALSQRPYSGVNVLLLWAAAGAKGYADNRWLTYKQALELGGHVRKGERSQTVIYVSATERQNDDGEIVRVPFLRSYNVFNVAQCDGINLPAEQPELPQHARDALRDQYIAATGATIEHMGSRACYVPSRDLILMPELGAFDSADAYYSTLFHEIIHWTGAPHRLNRTKGKRFGDQAYAYEELVAEFGAAFVCAEFGVDQLQPAASYIDNWRKVLTENNRLLVSAAAAASQAVEYTRGLAIAAPAPIADAA